MDWLPTLPPELSSRLDEMVETLESEQNMEYIDSITRLRMARGEAAAHQKGMASVLATLLKSRFRACPIGWQANSIKQAPMTLSVGRSRVLTAPNLKPFSAANRTKRQPGSAGKVAGACRGHDWPPWQ